MAGLEVGRVRVWILSLCALLLLSPAAAAQQKQQPKQQPRRPGGGFRLATMEFTGATVFPVELLISQFPIKSGDLIDFAKVRQGLENVRRMYDAKGYVNFSYKPGEKLDRAARTVSLMFELSEDKPYFVDKISFAGRQADERSLRAAIDPYLQKGKLFQYGKLDAALEAINRLNPAAPVTRQNCRVELEGHVEGRDGRVNVIFMVK